MPLAASAFKSAKVAIFRDTAMLLPEKSSLGHVFALLHWGASCGIK